MVVSYHSFNAEEAIFSFERASGVPGDAFGFLDSPWNADDGALLRMGRTGMESGAVN